MKLNNEIINRIIGVIRVIKLKPKPEQVNTIKNIVECEKVTVNINFKVAPYK